MLLMSCGDLDSKSSHLMRVKKNLNLIASKKQLSCSPYYLCMFQHELFLDFFSILLTPVYVWKFWNVIPLLPPFTFNFLELCSSSRHTCPWCHVFQEMTALKYRLSKNNKQSEPEYLPCVHSSSSNKHHCWCWSGWCCSSETCYRLNASDLTF